MVIWDFAYTGLGGCKRDALPTELTALLLIPFVYNKKLCKGKLKFKY